MSQRGAGSGEALFIMGLAAYFLFMGWLGNATGYTLPYIGHLGSWTIPSLHAGCASGLLCDIAKIFTGTTDIFITLLNVIAWFIQLFGSFFVLLGFGFTGALPVWVMAILFAIPGFGVGFIFLVVLRGGG